MSTATSDVWRMKSILNYLPWDTDIVFRNEVFTAGAQGNASSSIRAYVTHIASVEAGILLKTNQKSAPLQESLGISVLEENGRVKDVSLVPQDFKDWAPSNGNLLCLLYCAYRTIDVYAWLDGSAPLTRTIPRSVFSEMPTHLKKLLNWPEVVGQYRRLSAQRGSYAAASHTGPPHVRIMKELAAIYVSQKHEKTSQNLLHAAMLVAFLRETVFEPGEIPSFPTSLKQYEQSFLKWGMDETQIDFAYSFLDEEKAADLGGKKERMGVPGGQKKQEPKKRNRTRVHDALIAALCVSPLALLLPVSLSRIQLSRTQLLRYARALGNDKPPLLRQVEKTIWECVYKMSLAQENTEDLLAQLCCALPNEELESVSKKVREWFDTTSVAKENHVSSEVHADVVEDGPVPQRMGVLDFEMQPPNRGPDSGLLGVTPGQDTEMQPPPRVEEDAEMLPERERRTTEDLGMELENGKDNQELGSCNASKDTQAVLADPGEMDDADNASTGQSVSMKDDGQGININNEMDEDERDERGNDMEDDCDNDESENSDQCENNKKKDGRDQDEDGQRISSQHADSHEHEMDEHERGREHSHDGQRGNSHHEKDHEGGSDGNTSFEMVICDEEATNPPGPSFTRKSARLASRPYKSLRIHSPPRAYKKQSRQSALCNPLFTGDSASKPIDVDAYWDDINTKAFDAVLPELVAKTEAKRYYHERKIEAYGPTGKDYTFKAYFHFEELHDSLHSFLDAVQSLYIDGKPLHVADPTSSCIVVMTEAQYNALTVQEAHRLLEDKHILLTDCKSGSPPIQFDEDGLQTLRHLDSPVSIQDCSVPSDAPSDLRTLTGTVQQLLDSVRDPEGKILNALSFPSWRTRSEDRLLHTDVVAWEYSIGHIGCPDDKQFPSTTVYRGLANTANTFSYAHIDCSGFNTFVEVLTGTKVWFLTKPSKDSHSVFRLQGFSHDEADPKLHYEAVVLTPGDRLLMRANTIHAVYSPEPSICHGGHFYSTGTMRDTLSGIIHCFVYSFFITNSTLPLSSLLLRRIALFYYKGLVGTFSPRYSGGAHLPDVSTLQGALNLLALCNAVILGNVLNSRTYLGANQRESRPATKLEKSRMEKFDHNAIPYAERYELCQARAMCLQLLDWFAAHYEIVDARDPSKDSPYHLFASQCSVISAYKSIAHSQPADLMVHSKPDDLDRQIENVLNLYTKARDVQLSQPSYQPFPSNVGTSLDFDAEFLAVRKRDIPLEFIAAHEMDWFKLGCTPFDKKYFGSLSERAQLDNTLLEDEQEGQLPSKRRKHV